MTTAADSATRITAAINATGEAVARVWERDGYTRVYVSRPLSRGRRQDMGYIGIDERGNVVTIAIDRRRAWIESLCRRAVPVTRDAVPGELA